MAINLKNVTLSGNTVTLSASSGSVLKVTCGTCGHVETQPGGILQGNPTCPKCGAVGRISITIDAALKGEQPVASHPATNVSHNDASGSSVSDKQPAQPSGSERGNAA